MTVIYVVFKSEKKKGDMGEEQGDNAALYFYSHDSAVYAPVAGAQCFDGELRGADLFDLCHEGR